MSKDLVKRNVPPELKGPPPRPWDPWGSYTLPKGSSLYRDMEDIIRREREGKLKLYTYAKVFSDSKKE